MIKKDFYCDTIKDKEPLEYINLLSDIDKELNEVLDLKTNREDTLSQLILELNKSNWNISILNSKRK
ncbi:MAG: hypothetical protein QM493_11850 [Sulfurovum sp.]